MSKILSKKKPKKVCYTAPMMEAASFCTENGYATSGPKKTFNLGVGAGGL